MSDLINNGSCRHSNLVVPSLFAVVSTKAISFLLLSFWVKAAHGLVQRFLRHKTNVYVDNSLDYGLDLTLHCKSKDNDLGIKLLHFDETFKFTFRPTFWGTTEFFCSFQWKDRFEWFSIYVDNRDYPICYDCYWIVKTDGPCMKSASGYYDICYKWNPKFD
ncbi:S-protein homolog 5-like [Mercurialis annua]|uniref:S-protein homolog 5-like n=1 Tax=Mercurialis annua TaxID=3986 RepID=UPI002160C132|nr:S-protein homolog 5-like [Mercurialis annua]